MHRPLLVSLTAVFLTASIFAGPAQAQVKEGAKCTKISAKARAGTKTFTCGKDKKWHLTTAAVPVLNPRDPVRQIIARPLGTQSQTANEVFEPSVCSADGFAILQRLENNQWTDIATAASWRPSPLCTDPLQKSPLARVTVKEEDVLRWKIYPTGGSEWISQPFLFHLTLAPATPAPMPDSNITDYASVGLRARNAILSVTTYDHPNKWTVTYEANVPQENRDFITNTIDKAMAYLSYFFPSTTEVNAVVYTTKRWASEEILQYNRNNPRFTKKITEDLDNFGDRLPPCIGIGAFTIGYLPHPVIAIAGGCAVANDSAYGIAAHEIIHALQSVYAHVNAATCVAPTWWIEGQARAGSFAYANINGNSKWYESRRATMQLVQNPDTTALREVEVPYRDAEYTNGAAAMEYVIARSGWEKTFEVLTEAHRLSMGACLSGRDVMNVFAPAFQTVYGQSIDDFYREVQPYLKWVYTKESRLSALSG